MRQQQQQSCQPFLTGVEQLIDEVRFVSDEAGHQPCHQDLRERRLLVDQPCHGRLLDPGQPAVANADCRHHAKRLTGKTALPEELARSKRRDNRFLAFMGCHAESDLASEEEIHASRLAAPA